MDVIVAGCFAALIDQWTKHLVRTHFQARAVVFGGVSIRCSRLVRASFGHDRGRRSLAAIWLSAVAATAAIVAFGMIDNSLARIGLGTALGGALGNLIDIRRDHAVTDFIDLGWWPIFNVADIAIVCGLAAALWLAVVRP